MKNDKPLSMLRVTGASAENGIVDIDKTIDFLRGVDKATRFFIDREHGEIARRRYRINIKITEGSLVVALLGIAIVGGATAVGIAASRKITHKQHAENTGGQLGLGEVELEDPSLIIQAAVSDMRDTIDIAQHRGTMDGSVVKEAKVLDTGDIELTNSEGKSVVVTKRQFDIYRQAPRGLFRDMVSMVDEDSALQIDDKGVGEWDAQDADITSVGFEDKKVFDNRDDQSQEAALFPELIHGGTYELEGFLSRGNDETNTLGFKYQDHILTCTLHDGLVRDKKNMLFGDVRIVAVVNRFASDAKRDAPLRKPKLGIVSIEPIIEEVGQLSILSPKS